MLVDQLAKDGEVGGIKGLALGEVIVLAGHHREGVVLAD